MKHIFNRNQQTSNENDSQPKVQSKSRKLLWGLIKSLIWFGKIIWRLLRWVMILERLSNLDFGALLDKWIR